MAKVVLAKVGFQSRFGQLVSTVGGPSNTEGDRWGFTPTENSKHAFQDPGFKHHQNSQREREREKKERKLWPPLLGSTLRAPKPWCNPHVPTRPSMCNEDIVRWMEDRQADIHEATMAGTFTRWQGSVVSWGPPPQNGQHRARCHRWRPIQYVKSNGFPSCQHGDVVQFVCQGMLGMV